jgi:hypothetical protein
MLSSVDFDDEGLRILGEMSASQLSQVGKRVGCRGIVERLAYLFSTAFASIHAVRILSYWYCRCSLN